MSRVDGGLEVDEGREAVGAADRHDLQQGRDQPVFQAFQARLLETYRCGSLADVTGLVAREFPGRAHRLDDLFRDEQRRVLKKVLRSGLADTAAVTWPGGQVPRPRTVPVTNG